MDSKALESFLIPTTEGLFDKFKSKQSSSSNKFSTWEKMNFKGVHDSIEKIRLGNNLKSTGSNFDTVKREFDKSRNSKTDDEWNTEFNRAAIKDMMNEYKWKLDVDRVVKYFNEIDYKVFKITPKPKEKKDTIYRLEIDGNKALQYSNSIYSKKKKKNNRELIDTIEKDLKIALRKILSSQEVNNAFNDLCKEYNSAPRGEEFDDRFRFDGPAKLSVNWLKSQFKVENFEESDNEVIFEISNSDQEFTIFIANSILYALGDYIQNMYVNYIGVGHGDGDEGCLYINF